MQWTSEINCHLSFHINDYKFVKSFSKKLSNLCIRAELWGEYLGCVVKWSGCRIDPPGFTKAIQACNVVILLYNPFEDLV